MQWLILQLRRGIGILGVVGLTVAAWADVGQAQIGPAGNADEAGIAGRAVDYTYARFVVLGDPPRLLLARSVLASQLPALGLIDIGLPDDDPPLYLVVLRGEFGLNPWLESRYYGPEYPYSDQQRAQYIVLVLNLRTERPILWQTSRHGGLLRAVLDDPSLPDDARPSVQAIGVVEPPWSRTLPASAVAALRSLPCYEQAQFPGQARWCGVAPPCVASSGAIGIDSCGLEHPVSCFDRSPSPLPDVCGRIAATQYVEISIRDDGVVPAELSLPQGTEVLWVNRGIRSHTVTATSANSNAIAPGGQWSLTFWSGPTEFEYRDSLNPELIRGRLVFER